MDETIEAWRPKPRTTQGGQGRLPRLAILTAPTLQALFRPALRQTKGLTGSVVGPPGLDLAVPDHSALCRRAETPDVPRPKPRRNAPRFAQPPPASAPSFTCVSIASPS